MSALASVARGIHVGVIVVLLGTFLTPATATAELKVRWDCYLPSGYVDCLLLESSLKGMIPFLRIVPPSGDADVTVSITNVAAEDGTRFKLDFAGKPVDGRVAEVHLMDKIPSSIEATTGTVRVLTWLERGLADFMDQKVVSEVKEGTLDLRLTDPVSRPFTGRPEQSGVKWYVTPAVGVYFSDVVGVGINAADSAAVSFNYSGSHWRLQHAISVRYSQQSQPVAGTNETASIQFLDASTSHVVARAISADNRWSAGLLLSVERNPQANYAVRANGSVGLEFDLIPRQTANQKNFGFRCAIGPEFHRYDATNVQGLREQLVGRQFCDLFFAWHFHVIDLGASLGETSMLDDLAFRSFSASLSATWRLTDNLSIVPWVTMQQVGQAINEAQPVDVNYTDPRQEVEASMLAAVQQSYTASFGIQTGLSIRYVFGNGSLSIEDQRWQGASNLR